MHVCLVYDCLFPHTVGGAERWYRALAETLAEGGHEVTYVTRRQWPSGERPDAPRGTRVAAVSPGAPLYTADGRRSMGPPLRFGAGVLRHLQAHGDRYDAVHTASFPYFSVLAAAAARSKRPFHLLIDWHELWTRGYWHEYLGRVRGDAGWLVQRACVTVPHRAFCFSRLHERRLREEGFRGEVTILPGEYAGHGQPPPEPCAVEPLVVFAGRHIPEKRVPALIPALARAHQAVPGLRAEILGEGPDTGRVRALVRAEGLQEIVALRGFVPPHEVQDVLARAMCMVLPSSREGYGLVVVEAAAVGTPSVVVSGPDNAATELIEEEVNGVIAPSTSPEDLSAAIARIHEAGPALRASTAKWFTRNAHRLSLRRSLETVLAAYGEPAPPGASTRA